MQVKRGGVKKRAQHERDPRNVDSILSFGLNLLSDLDKSHCLRGHSYFRWLSYYVPGHMYLGLDLDPNNGHIQ